MNPDGTNQVPLTTTPEFEFEPQFAPDTNEIVYSVTGTAWNIFIINVDTKMIRQLTNNQSINRAPDWK